MQIQESRLRVRNYVVEEKVAKGMRRMSRLVSSLKKRLKQVEVSLGKLSQGNPRMAPQKDIMRQELEGMMSDIRVALRTMDSMED